MKRKSAKKTSNKRTRVKKPRLHPRVLDLLLGLGPAKVRRKSRTVFSVQTQLWFLPMRFLIPVASPDLFIVAMHHRTSRGEIVFTPKAPISMLEIGAISFGAPWFLRCFSEFAVGDIFEIVVANTGRRSAMFSGVLIGASTEEEKRS